MPIPSAGGAGELIRTKLVHVKPNLLPNHPKIPVRHFELMRSRHACATPIAGPVSPSTGRFGSGPSFFTKSPAAIMAIATGLFVSDSSTTARGPQYSIQNSSHDFFH